MSDLVEILSRQDIGVEAASYLRAAPYEFTSMFDTFLRYRYKITLEQFDKIIKESIPEELL